jgi:hypothetical protein
VAHHLSPDTLQTMTALAERNTFAGTAEQMYLTYAAISQRVKRLEAQLGQAVFQSAGEACDRLAREQGLLVRRAFVAAGVARCGLNVLQTTRCHARYREHAHIAFRLCEAFIETRQARGQATNLGIFLSKACAATGSESTHRRPFKNDRVDARKHFTLTLHLHPTNRRSTV